VISIAYYKMNIDDEWAAFLENNGDAGVITNEPTKTADHDVPECEELKISTNTKVLYLNQEVDINNVFWNIPVSPYQTREECVIKKQIKIINRTPEELADYQEKVAKLNFYREYIIRQINNPDTRGIKFKDERKLTVGLSKKDIVSCKSKVKNAFYNCFALTLRFWHEGFREIHVKVFNTGKLEIPGILSQGLLDAVKPCIIKTLSPWLPCPVEFIKTDTYNNVLINSNFNCGYHIHRDALYRILREKYRIETSFDACSYPGIKCRYYYNVDMPEDEQSGRVEHDDNELKRSELDASSKYCEVSFMIFRTGSCLIVGNCCENILYHVYRFIRGVLEREIDEIRIANQAKFVKEKKSHARAIKYVMDIDYHKLISANK